MSIYGKKWKIDGLICGSIHASDYLGEGVYTLHFERAFASLEQIEKINWAHPKVEYLKSGKKEAGLPEGYGFQITNITYAHNCKTYCVKVKTTQQYMGDVTQYQAKIDDLTAANTEQQSTIAALTEALEEADELVISLYEAQAAAENADEEVEA